MNNAIASSNISSRAGATLGRRNIISLMGAVKDGGEGFLRFKEPSSPNPLRNVGDIYSKVHIPCKEIA